MVGGIRKTLPGLSLCGLSTELSSASSLLLKWQQHSITGATAHSGKATGTRQTHCPPVWGTRSRTWSGQEAASCTARGSVGCSCLPHLQPYGASGGGHWGACSKHLHLREGLHPGDHPTETQQAPAQRHFNQRSIPIQPGCAHRPCLAIPRALATHPLVTRAILPAITPAFIHLRAVEVRLAQLAVHFIVQTAQPLGEGSPGASIWLILAYPAWGSTGRRVVAALLSAAKGGGLGTAVSYTWRCPHAARGRNSENRADPGVS